MDECINPDTGNAEDEVENAKIFGFIEILFQNNFRLWRSKIDDSWGLSYNNIIPVDCEEISDFPSFISERFELALKYEEKKQTKIFNKLFEEKVYYQDIWKCYRFLIENKEKFIKI